MPNPRGRGRNAEDAHRVLTAEFAPDGCALLVTTAGHPGPLRLELPNTKLGQQLLEAIWSMVPLAGRGGGWASATTISRSFRHAEMLHESFEASGIHGFDDRDLAFAHFLPVRDQVRGRWRSVRRAFVWALREHHPNGHQLAEQLLADRLDSTVENPTMAYSENVAVAIEDAARARFLEWVSAHRRFLADVGVDTSDPAWIRLSAHDVMSTARQTDSPAARLLLRHLEGGVASAGPVPGADVSASDLAAAAVLLVLADDLGHNWSALQSLTPDSVVPVGPDAAVIDSEKARARTGLRVMSSTADLHSFAGVVTALVGLTRFARQRRRTAATTPQLRRNARLLFVTSEEARVLDSPVITPWGRQLKGQVGEGLSMLRLRETANLRGKRRTGRGTAVGHSSDQNNRYLAEGIPPGDLAALVLGAQDDIVDRARRAVNRDPDVDARAVERLSQVNPDRLVDRGVVTCGNGARDPEGDAWCNRGILACFTCPSGYRTPANIPGLVAAVALTDGIRRSDPEEWATGPARTLNAYARAALEQFPSHARDVDPKPLLPVVAANYWEIRG